MTKDQLIAKQQIEIEELKELIKRHKASVKKVYGLIYAIGAPLNDNVLQFNEKQMVVFHRIAKALNLI